MAQGRYSNSELIKGRPSDARALASMSACSHCLRVRFFPLNQNSAGNPEAAMKLAIERGAIEQAAVDFRRLCFADRTTDQSCLPICHASRARTRITCCACHLPP